MVARRFRVELIRAGWSSHVLLHARQSLRIPGQTNLSATSLVVAFVPGWLRECMASKAWRLIDSTTNGLGTGSEKIDHVQKSPKFPDGPGFWEAFYGLDFLLQESDSVF